MERSDHDVTGSNVVAMNGETEQKHETYQPPSRSGHLNSKIELDGDLTSLCGKRFLSRMLNLRSRKMYQGLEGRMHTAQLVTV